MQYTWQLALVLVPVYFIKHSVSCYIYYTPPTNPLQWMRSKLPVPRLCQMTRLGWHAHQWHRTVA